MRKPRPTDIVTPRDVTLGDEDRKPEMVVPVY